MNAEIYIFIGDQGHIRVGPFECPEEYVLDNAYNVCLDHGETMGIKAIKAVVDGDINWNWKAP